MRRLNGRPAALLRQVSRLRPASRRLIADHPPSCPIASLPRPSRMTTLASATPPSSRSDSSAPTSTELFRPTLELTSFVLSSPSPATASLGA